ncbi:hypothetical protein PanWU01x14_336950 [Parasponia andersonii]|uniref:Uncharacterized protein n=1 Tax=Parasponia andersonii TaxID=3476 RepID=A0A2P5AFQ3_PARAD|nr:hypothetical protein PanWU01x14_336950 [Parasponia andersonii]
MSYHMRLMWLLSHPPGHVLNTIKWGNYASSLPIRRYVWLITIIIPQVLILAHANPCHDFFKILTLPISSHCSPLGKTFTLFDRTHDNGSEPESETPLRHGFRVRLIKEAALLPWQIHLTKGRGPDKLVPSLLRPRRLHRLGEEAPRMAAIFPSSPSPPVLQSDGDSPDIVEHQRGHDPDRALCSIEVVFYACKLTLIPKRRSYSNFYLQPLPGHLGLAEVGQVMGFSLQAVRRQRGVVVSLGERERFQILPLFLQTSRKLCGESRFEPQLSAGRLKELEEVIIFGSSGECRHIQAALNPQEMNIILRMVSHLPFLLDTWVITKHNRSQFNTSGLNRFFRD